MYIRCVYVGSINEQFRHNEWNKCQNILVEVWFLFSKMMCKYNLL